MAHILFLVASKLLKRATFIIIGLMLLSVTALSVYAAVYLLPNSAYDIVAVFLVLIIGSHLLARVAQSYVDA